MLEFNYEEIEEFIRQLEDMIDNLYDEMDTCELIKEEVQEVVYGSAIDKYSDYKTDMDDYQATIDFYEAIKDDLQEFYDNVNENVTFGNGSNFYYDNDLENDIKNLSRKTEKLEHDCKISIWDKEYTPFGMFNRGNFLDQGSPEEELIDSNDGKMKNLAEEINSGLKKLVEKSENIESIFNHHFKDLEDTREYSKYYEDYDGISKEHHEWVKGALLVGGAVIGTIAAFATGVGEVAAAGIVEEELLIGGVEATEEVEMVKGIDNVEELGVEYSELNIPEGYENYHTGRYEFNTLEEKYSMEEVMSNPLEGSKKLKVTINDPNVPQPAGDWAKYSKVIDTPTKTIEIHFIYNEKTEEFMDFKIKKIEIKENL